MQLSSNALHLLKQWETCKLEAYQDVGGVWTIGWGSIQGVFPGTTISQQQADQRLAKDVQEKCAAVSTLVKVPLTQNQFDALLIFTYNLGEGTLSRSTLLKLVNKKDFSGAAAEFLKWNHVDGKEVAGLTRRRQAEKELFCNGV